MKANDLTERHAKDIKGVLHCFDRLVLFGTYKSICWPEAMESHLQERRMRLLDYEKGYANALRLEVAGQVKAVACEEGLALIQVNPGQRKEALVETLLEKRGRREGIVCILGAMERCSCYLHGSLQRRVFVHLKTRA